MYLNVDARKYYEKVDVSGTAHLGDNYHGSQEYNIDMDAISAQLRALELNVSDTTRQLEAWEKQRREERYVKVREWIAAPMPYIHHESALKVHIEYPNTGLWILQHDLVATWMKDDIPRDPILWIHGMPGAGIYESLMCFLHAYSLQVKQSLHPSSSMLVKESSIHTQPISTANLMIQRPTL